MKARSGFTLIELLVVMAIIGIMAGFSLNALQSSLAKARDAVRQNDLHQIAIALEQYRTDHNEQYPLAGGGEWICSNGGVDWINGLYSYLKYQTPVDPTNTGGVPWSGVGNQLYCYRSNCPTENIQGHSYILAARMEASPTFGSTVTCPNNTNWPGVSAYPGVLWKTSP